MTSAINPMLLDLALILVVAGVVTIIFKALRQPLVLGYIVAGILTGPYIGWVPTATEVASVEFWGKIGVIFLLFGLGLEFSFKQLKKVGGPGATTVLTEAVVMFSMGFLIAKIFGWETITALFVGAMLSISSTSIIIKTFDDLKIGGKKSSQLVFGALICEDIVAILLLVLLPTFVISKTFNGVELATKILGITVFLLLWFTGGIYFIPTIYKKLRKLMSEETLIVVSLGLCLFMVVVTLKANISEALGAFVMGSILSGTVQRDRIVSLIRPIKDFFGAIFFVSVGMLVDPAVLLHYWPHVLVITLAVILVKPIAATIGFMFSGQALKIALPAGMCMCQIGEFSYIIASLGKSMNATPDYLYPVIVTVSILTTFITPYWAKGGEKTFSFIYSHSSGGWRNVIDRLGSGKNTFNQQSRWKKLLKNYLGRVFILTTWMAFIIILFTKVINPFLNNLVKSLYPEIAGMLWIRLIMFVLTIAAIAPFMWALLRLKDKEGLYDQIWADGKFARGPLLFLQAIKYMIAFMALAFVASLYLTRSTGVVILICATIIVFVVLSQRIKGYYSRIERNFLSNLDSEGGSRFVVPREMANEIHMEKCTVGQNSYLAGRTIGEVHRKKDTGALVIQLIRGSRVINLPHKEQTFYPSDSLLILGSDKQLGAFIELSKDRDKDPSSELNEETIEMRLFQITLGSRAPVVGHNANITAFRKQFGVLLVGVEKSDSDVFLRPNSTVTIEKGDTIWVVGNHDKVNSLNIPDE
ncbi:MAG: cation:proton antiporter [Bacteroidales bacterium]|nr:cation:proton antiporter [Bacteroidales bacterium]